MIESLGPLLFASLFIFMVCIGFISGHEYAREKTMQEAYDRGYAVQCEGETGYYWECDHD